MISDRIIRNIKEKQDKPFLISSDASVQTYRELEARAAALSGFIPEKSIAAIMLQSPANMIPAILACWSKNTVPAILDPQIKHDKFDIIKKIVRLSLIVADNKLDSQFDSEKRVDVKTDIPHQQNGFIRLELNIADDVPALFLFTSGSTGIPKCVPLSLANIWANIEDFSRILKIGEDDVFISTSPLFYAHALYNSFFSALFLGTTVIYNGVLNIMNAGNAVHLANKYKATIYHLTPSMMQIMIMMAGRFKEPFPKFRHIICGTARLEPDLKKKFENTFACIVTQQYGMTETLFITVNVSKQLEAPESVGIPVACEIKIADDDGNPVLKGISGDIAVKSKSSYGSYFNQPEETQASYIDGWFLTGDEGRIDDDGYLTVTGRKKEIIKKGGVNINPHEINAVLSQFPNVADAATSSIPDPVYGEEIYSFVAGKDLTEEKILAFCRAKLAKTHVPKRILIMDKIPKTATGKNDIVGLKNIALKIKF